MAEETGAKLMWDSIEWARLRDIIADTPIERRWANADGELSPDFGEHPGFTRLAIIIDGKILLQDETLVRDEAGDLHIRSAA